MPYETNSPDVNIASGTAATTIANGADVNAGATTDAAVTTDVAATQAAKLRGLVKILADVWDSVNQRLKVAVTAALPAGDAAIGRVKVTDGVAVASVRDLAANDALNVAIVDGAGAQITSFGGGTQYTEGDVDASITGTALMWEDAGDVLRPASAAKPLPVTSAAPASVASVLNSSSVALSSSGVFTGSGEAVLVYAGVSVNLWASHDSQVDGLSIEWSNDGANWDRAEKWDYAATKPFSVCLRPKGEFYRLVYSNAGAAQSAFRLETIFHPAAPRAEGFIESGRVLVDGVSYKVKWKKINATASGDNTILAAVSGKKLRVLTIWHTGSDSIEITYKSGANALVDAEAFAKQGGLGLNLQPAGFVLETNAGEAFIMSLSAVKNVRGALTYIEI